MAQTAAGFYCLQGSPAGHLNPQSQQRQSRRQRDKTGKQRPAMPGAQRSQQFNIAVSQPFPFSNELISPVHRCECAIAGDGAEDGLRQPRFMADKIKKQPEPEQRAGKRIGQKVTFEIAKAQSDIQHQVNQQEGEGGYHHGCPATALPGV